MLSRLPCHAPKTMSSSDPLRCPLCGQSNQCGQADPTCGEQPCWCFSAEIAAEVLQRIPQAARGRNCLCPDCPRGGASATTEQDS